MTARDLNHRLYASPFRPFRIALDDGKYTVVKFYSAAMQEPHAVADSVQEALALLPSGAAVEIEQLT